MHRDAGTHTQTHMKHTRCTHTTHALSAHDVHTKCTLSMRDTHYARTHTHTHEAHAHEAHTNAHIEAPVAKRRILPFLLPLRSHTCAHR